MANPIAGFPDATNTGVPEGTNLEPYTGPMTITQAGTVIEGKTISGEIVVTAPDVVIKNCVIQYHSSWGVNAEHADNITVQNCRIVGPGTSGDSNAGILGSGNFIGNDISASENGIVLTNGGSTVKGNYIHDLQDGGSGPHYDGISVQGGQDGVLIQDNTVVGRDTSDVFIKDDFGPINDITVDHNLLIGSPGYNVYVDGRGDGGPITNVSITDNYVQEGFYGTYAVQQASPTISGNIEFAKGEVPPGETTADPAPSEPTPSDPAPAPSEPTDPAPTQSGAVIDGTAGNDTLVGTAADNVIDGEGGKDTMTGGAGDDVFVFDSLSDMGSGGRSDVITDFQQGSDKIDLSSIDANGSAAGDASFHFQAEEDASFDREPGALAYHFVDRSGTDRDMTVIQGDTDGDGVHDFEINLKGLVQLKADDFAQSSSAGESDTGSQPAPTTEAGTEPAPTPSVGVIDGTDGNDTLVGTAADNVINGEGGKDLLTGQAGDDVFVFDSVSDMGSGWRSDVITDFRQGSDKIDLSSIDANGSAAGDAAFHFQAQEDASFDRAPGALAYHFVDRAGTDDDMTVIQGDINGDGVHNFEINLHGLVQLHADDFTL